MDSTTGMDVIDLTMNSADQETCESQNEPNNPLVDDDEAARKRIMDFALG